MKIGIVGSTGHMAYVIAGVAADREASLQGVSVVSSGETVDPLLQCVRQYNLPAPRVYNDYREMLDQAKPDVVGVGPHYGDHARVVLEALRRGIHVFVEKPVATTFADLDAVETAFAHNRADLSCMLALRYNPGFMAAWQAVRNGEIGTVRLLAAQKSYKLGQRPGFFKCRESYGGTIPWVGSHGIDLLHWFCGEAFVAVYASHSARFNRNHGDMELTALCQFTFANEVFGSCSIDYLRPAKAKTHGDDRLRAVGTEGIVEVRDGQARIINETGDDARVLDLAPERQIFIDFLDHLRGRAPCRVTARDAFITTRACLLARESADYGRLVFFPDGK